MRSLQHFTKIPTAVIKANRNKVIQTIDREKSIYYVVKIMVFHSLHEFLWFQKDVGDRLDVLRRINGLGIISIVERGLCTVQVKQKGSERCVYLSRREVVGPTLLKILEKQSLVIHILRMKDIKQVIWNIFALMIAGGGFNTLIVTLQNLIFEEIGGGRYKPTLNYLSFVGTRLLRGKKDVERDQFLEIGMFLDQQALESGNIDRFQFKCRNFAIIVLSLLLRKHPNNFIFQNVVLPNSISIDYAKKMYEEVIKPRIKELLSFKTLKTTFKLLNIPGLQHFIHSALGYQAPIQDWSMVQNILLQQNNGGSEGQYKISKLLWEKESIRVKELLSSKGLGLCKNGARIYLAFKMSVHLECLLQFNDWKTMMGKLKHNYKTNQLFYRLLQCVSVGQGSVVQQTTKELLQLSKQSFRLMDTIDNKTIFTQSYQRSILNAYQQLMQ